MLSLVAGNSQRDKNGARHEAVSFLVGEELVEFWVGCRNSAWASTGSEQSNQVKVK